MKKVKKQSNLVERLNKQNGLKRIIRTVSDYEILEKLEVPIREEKPTCASGYYTLPLRDDKSYFPSQRVRD